VYCPKPIGVREATRFTLILYEHFLPVAGTIPFSHVFNDLQLSSEKDPGFCLSAAKKCAYTGDSIELPRERTELSDPPTLVSKFLVGHESVLSKLAKLLLEPPPGHAPPRRIYLTGEAGFGKTTILRVFAQAMLVRGYVWSVHAIDIRQIVADISTFSDIKSAVKQSIMTQASRVNPVLSASYSTPTFPPATIKDILSKVDVLDSAFPLASKSTYEKRSLILIEHASDRHLNLRDDILSCLEEALHDIGDMATVLFAGTFGLAVDAPDGISVSVCGPLPNENMLTVILSTLQYSYPKSFSMLQGSIRNKSPLQYLHTQWWKFLDRNSENPSYALFFRRHHDFVAVIARRLDRIISTHVDLENADLDVIIDTAIRTSSVDAFLKDYVADAPLLLSILKKDQLSDEQQRFDFLGECISAYPTLHTLLKPLTTCIKVALAHLHLSTWITTLLIIGYLQSQQAEEAEKPLSHQLVRSFFGYFKTTPMSVSVRDATTKRNHRGRDLEVIDPITRKDLCGGLGNKELKRILGKLQDADVEALLKSK
jgi:hypothetical protein